MSTDNDVKTLREVLRMTQAQFASEMGVDQGTVSNWETGKTSPSGPAKKIMERMREGAQQRAAKAAA